MGQTPENNESETPSEKKNQREKVTQVGMGRLVSLLTILTAIILLGITFLRVLYPFLLPLFLAGVVAVICQPMFRYFLNRTKQRRTWAAGLTTSCIVAIILVPLVTTITIGGLQLYSVINNELSTHAWTKSIASFKDNIGFRQIAIRLNQITPLPKEQTDEIAPNLIEDDKPIENKQPVEKESEVDDVDSNVDEEEATDDKAEVILSEEAQAKLDAEKQEKLDKDFERAIKIREDQLRDGLQKGLTKILQQTFSPGTALGTLGFISQFGSILMSCAIFVFALFYFLQDGTQLIEASENLIPVRVQHLREILREFSVVVRAVVLATMLAALGQGLAVSLVLYFLGFGHFFIYSIVAILCALIPFVGTTIVWIPCCIYLISQGAYGSAIFLGLWGSVVVGTMDNVIRAYVLNSDAKLHPLLAFVAILGGLQVMGLWGVFIAPIIASCLHALIKIFNSELYEMSVTAMKSETESLNIEIGTKSKEPEPTKETKKPTKKKK